ncbi:hypothetical protein SAMN05421823_10859 [Catalinimonas alkaloidigena]|uniref:Uncharacterized protein n=1 Tax=Catalinimonas alkaloidigena TaxID=1075417 RepID=A0A1G9MR34_9BACT|nr:hypothetical protein [Catalinimonas alkaloidigena]SDL76573.1 hypothetical protein SAMN05421823_10859 [Catalinimonas alkaloidigena]
MKKTVILVTSLALVAACTDPKESAEYQSATAVNDSLMQVINQKEAELDQVVNSITEIENNLAAIDRDKMIISDIQKEGRDKTQQERINEMISGIDSYIASNREKIDKLESQVRNSRNTSAGLNRLIAQLKSSIEEKERQIEELRGNMAMLQGEVDTLRTNIRRREEELATRQRQIDEQDAAMTTAYFRVGSRRELADDDIVKKEGGVLGIGRTLKMADHVDPGKFTQVNTRYLNQISLGDTKRHNLVSAHPEGSYNFEEVEDNAYLKINDPEAFWSVSKYLVIEVD